MMTILPFEAALGTTLEEAAPDVRTHFRQPSGTQRYRGIMARVWRRDGWQGRIATPFLHLASRDDLLFGHTGVDVPFELENVVTRLPDGRATMTWTRIFHFPEGTQRFHAFMFFDPENGLIVDKLGKTGRIAVELEAHIVDQALDIRSGRQFLEVGRWRVPIPAWLTGQAHVREWQNSDGSLGICVVVHNPILGDFFGYEGRFAHVAALKRVA